MLDRAKRAATEGLDCSSGMITRLELCVMPNLWSDGDACNFDTRNCDPAFTSWYSRHTIDGTDC